MRIFLDTEFTGLHQYTTLISIGLAAENGDVFYAECTDYDAAQVDDWVNINVLSHLSGDLSKDPVTSDDSVHFCQGSKIQVASYLKSWLERYGNKDEVEIWADVLAWDWVLFCALFEGKLPEQVQYIPRDLSTLMVLRGIDPDTDREKLGKVTWTHPQIKMARHHALYDAILEKDIFEKIY